MTADCLSLLYYSVELPKKEPLEQDPTPGGNPLHNIPLLELADGI